MGDLILGMFWRLNLKARVLTVSFEAMRGIKWGKDMVRAQRAPENPISVDGMYGAITAVLLGRINSDKT